MKTSIETIGGKQYTVLWHKGESPDTAAIGQEAAWKELDSGVYVLYANPYMCHIATALPALPRHPKPEDAWLLYRYMAEGLYPHGTNAIGYAETGEPIFIGGIGKITHAVLAETGERVEIAITDGGEK